MASTYSGGIYSNRDAVYASFLKAGLSPQEAANITGVVSNESGGSFYTGSYGYQGTENGGSLNQGGAYGLAQFNGSRQQDLLDFARDNNSSPSDLDTQTAFIAAEGKQMGVDFNSVSDIVKTYENPAARNVAPEIQRGQDVSDDIMSDQDYYKNPYGDSYENTPGSGAYTQNNGAGAAGELPSFAQGPGGATDPYYSGTIGDGSMPAFNQAYAYGHPGVGTGAGSDFNSIDPNYTQNNGAGAAGDVPAAAGDSGTASGDSAPPLNVPVGSGDVGEEDTSLGSVEYTDPGVTLPEGSADSSDGTDSGMDVPSAIDGLAAVEAANTNATNKSLISAANTQAKASQNSDKVFQALGSQLTKQIQQAVTQQTSTAQDMRVSGESFMTNLFVRGFLILLGLIFVAVALSFFKPVQDNVVQPIARGSRRVAKMTAEAA